MIRNFLSYRLAHLCNIAINLHMLIIITFYQIIHWHYYINIFSIIYFCIIYLTIYFTFISNEWSTILNITPLFLSFPCLSAALSPAPVIVILPLTHMYASLWSNPLDFYILVLNLRSLLVLYTPLDWSFISIQFLALNVDLVYCLANLLFFDVPLL